MPSTQSRSALFDCRALIVFFGLIATSPYDRRKNPNISAWLNATLNCWSGPSALAYVHIGPKSNTAKTAISSRIERTEITEWENPAQKLKTESRMLRSYPVTTTIVTVILIVLVAYFAGLF